MKKIHCECPVKAQEAYGFYYSPEEEIAKNHEPNKCKGTYELQEYIRNGNKIWLCSCCCLPGDIPTGKLVKDSNIKEQNMRYFLLGLYRVIVFPFVMIIVIPFWIYGIFQGIGGGSDEWGETPSGEMGWKIINKMFLE